LRNKLIIEKDKQLIDLLKFKHKSITETIEQLNDDKLNLETKLINNLICPTCYSILKSEKYEDYIHYDCTNCWFETNTYE